MKVVISGGPGTGKSSIIDNLGRLGFSVFRESSREITKKYKKLGQDQLFLSEPVKFSRILLQNRITQHKESNNIDENLSFFDRGIPDILAYLEYKKISYSEEFQRPAEEFKYDAVFIAEPWRNIYKKDNERYESFEELIEINKHIKNTYSNFGYELILLPASSVKERVEFILDKINER